MDNIKTILDAIMVNATPNTPAEFTEDQIGYARNQFMESLQTELEGESSARDLVKRYLESPDVWEGPLIDAMQKAGVPQNDAIIEAAREVLRYAAPLDPDQVAPERVDDEELPSTLPGIVEDFDE